MDEFLATSSWASVIAAQGGRISLPAHQHEQTQGALVIFRRFGVRVGFLGFPIAGAKWDVRPITDVCEHAEQMGRRARVDLVRVVLTRPLADTALEEAVALLPEYRIDQLQQSDPLASKRIRKDLGFARRKLAGWSIDDAVQDAGQADSVGQVLHRLYVNALAKQRARPKYRQSYFSALLCCSLNSSAVRVVTGVDQAGVIQGFAASMTSAGVTYYLHGAVSDHGRRLGLADALLARQIDHASALGAGQFSMMASPWGQPGLLDFKSKWAPCRAVAATFDVPITVLGAGVRAVTARHAGAHRRHLEVWRRDS